MPTDLIGVVLAGGQSSRMGQDKANLKYKNKRLIDHMMQLLTDSHVKDVFVSGDIKGYHCILDVYRKLGPLGGVFSVLMTMQVDCTLLFVPVDMPLLNTKLLNNLLRNLNDFDAICYQNYPLPFVIKNNNFSRKIIEKIILDQTSNNYSIKDFLKRFNTNHLTLLDINLEQMTNVNTLLQWNEIINKDPS